MSIQIPESDRERFARLLALNPQQLEGLRVAIDETAPFFDYLELVETLKQKLAIDPAVLSDAVRLLITLYSVRAEQGLEPAEMAEQLSEAAKSSKDSRLSDPPAGWQALKASITSLLSLDHSLGVTAKAAFLAGEYPRHAHASRILTDARPVFSRRPDEGPTAFLINHSLHIEASEDGDDCNWFVAMNAQDLRDLKKAIDRALAKEEGLRQTLGKTGIPVLA